MKKTVNTAIIDLVFFIYFLFGAIFSVSIEYNFFEIPEIIASFYVYTFIWAFFIYVIYGCFCVKHRNILMNIFDGLLCFILTCFYPYPIVISLYENYKNLYYVLSGIFIFLPIIFSFIDKEKIDFEKIIKVFTRVAMIIFIIMIVLMLQSCGNGIVG